MNPVIHRTVKVIATVILTVFVCVVVFSLLVSCSTFREDKNFSYDCNLECEVCEDLKLECGNDLGHEQEGEDKGVNIINDLGGIVK